MKNNFFIKPCGIPQIEFAHSFTAKQYSNHFKAKYPETQFIEIAYIKEGEVTFTKENGEKIFAKAGSAVCIPSHMSMGVQASVPHTHHTVGFRLNYTVENGDSSDSLCLSNVMVFSESGRVLSLIDEIIRLHTIRTKGMLACSGLFLELLEWLDRHNRESEFNSDEKLYIRRAKEYIFANLHSPIHQRDIALHLGITPEYLCNIFKAAEGVSVIKFVNLLKLEQIRTLMTAHNLTLAAASEQYGYNDPNYVSRLHKKYFGYNITEA